MTAAPAKKGPRENPFASIIGQSQVSRFLAEAHAAGALSHAYLLAGPMGSGKTETALAIAKALICPDGGCGICDACRRIERTTHPDVHWIEPEGVGSYLAEQIRDVIRDCTLAPIRANRKVYIITRADLLRDKAANAFLKTLEEPPADTSFVLMARMRSSVLPTIVSRCQTLTFRRLPEAEALGLVCRATGASEQDARVALTATGGSTKSACEFIKSPSRKQARLVAIEVMERLVDADGADVLECARRMVSAVDAPQEELRALAANDMQGKEEFLSKGALNYLEKRNDRRIAAGKREVFSEMLSVIRSWLRDCAAVGFEREKLMVNYDCHYTIEKTGAQLGLDAILRALQAVDVAAERIARNVAPQLALEAMLFEIREVLYAGSSAR